MSGHDEEVLGKLSEELADALFANEHIDANKHADNNINTDTEPDADDDAHADQHPYP